MKAEDSGRFAMAWQAAHQVYGKSVESAVIALVFKVLERFPIEDVERAIGAHLNDRDTGQFPPKPADVVRHIEGSTDELVAVAWAMFREATRSGDMPKDEILRTVIRRMGGLEVLGDRLSRDLDFMLPQFTALWLASREPARLGIAFERREAITQH